MLEKIFFRIFFILNIFLFYNEYKCRWYASNPKGNRFLVPDIKAWHFFQKNICPNYDCQKSLNEQKMIKNHWYSCQILWISWKTLNLWEVTTPSSGGLCKLPDMFLIRTRGDLANGGDLIPRKSRDAAQKNQGSVTFFGFSEISPDRRCAHPYHWCKKCATISAACTGL